MTKSERTLGLVAAAIAIFVFVTGIPSLRNSQDSTTPAQATPEVTNSVAPVGFSPVNVSTNDTNESARRSSFALAELNGELKSILFRGWYPEQTERIEYLLNHGADLNSLQSPSLYTSNAQTDPEAIEFLHAKGYRFDNSARDSLCRPAIMSAAEFRSERGRRAFELLQRYGAARHCSIPIGYVFVQAVLDDPKFSVSEAIEGLEWLRAKGIDLNAKFTVDDSWMSDPIERRTGKTLRDVLVQQVMKRDSVQQQRLEPLIEYFTN
jgi:hypothetical protein